MDKQLNKVIAIGVIGLLLVMLLRNAFKIKVPGVGKVSHESLPDSYESEINYAISGGPTRTINNSDAANIAANLRDAMFGSWLGLGWGTDEDAIFSQISFLRNETDWLMVVKAFGLTNGMTLTQALESELGTADRKKVSDMLRAIGVTIAV